MNIPNGNYSYSPHHNLCNSAHSHQYLGHIHQYLQEEMWNTVDPHALDTIGRIKVVGYPEKYLHKSNVPFTGVFFYFMEMFLPTLACC